MAKSYPWKHSCAAVHWVHRAVSVQPKDACTFPYWWGHNISLVIALPITHHYISLPVFDAKSHNTSVNDSHNISVIFVTLPTRVPMYRVWFFSHSLYTSSHLHAYQWYPPPKYKVKDLAALGMGGGSETWCPICYTIITQCSGAFFFLHTAGIYYFFTTAKNMSGYTALFPARTSRPSNCICTKQVCAINNITKIRNAWSRPAFVIQVVALPFTRMPLM